MSRNHFQVSEENFYFCVSCFLAIASMGDAFLEGSLLPRDSESIPNIRDLAREQGVPFEFERLPLEEFLTLSAQSTRAAASTFVMLETASHMFGLDQELAYQMLGDKYEATGFWAWSTFTSIFETGMDILSLLTFVATVISPLPGDEAAAGAWTLARLQRVLRGEELLQFSLNGVDRSLNFKLYIDKVNRGKYAMRLWKDGINVDSTIEFFANAFLLSLLRKGTVKLNFLPDSLSKEAKQRIAFSIAEIVAHGGDTIYGNSGGTVDMTSIADKIDSITKALNDEGIRISRADVESAIQTGIFGKGAAGLPELDRRLIEAGSLIPEDQRILVPDIPDTDNDGHITKIDQFTVWFQKQLDENPGIDIPGFNGPIKTHDDFMAFYAEFIFGTKTPDLPDEYFNALNADIGLMNAYAGLMYVTPGHTGNAASDQAYRDFIARLNGILGW